MTVKWIKEAREGYLLWSPLNAEIKLQEKSIRQKYKKWDTNIRRESGTENEWDNARRKGKWIKNTQ